MFQCMGVFPPRFGASAAQTAPSIFGTIFLASKPFSPFSYSEGLLFAEKHNFNYHRIHFVKNTCSFHLNPKMLPYIVRYSHSSIKQVRIGRVFYRKSQHYRNRVVIYRCAPFKLLWNFKIFTCFYFIYKYETF